MKKTTGDNSSLPDIVVAAYEGDFELVRKLLAEGADPNSVDPGDNLSLLHIACLQGDEKLADTLLQFDAENGGLDFTIKSTYRPRFAWQFAANANRLDLATRVHEAGIAKEDAGVGAPSP